MKTISSRRVKGNKYDLQTIYDYNMTGTINALHNKNVTIILVIKHAHFVNMLQFLFVKQMLETGTIKRYTYSKCASLAISTLMHSTLPARAALCMGVSPLASLRESHKKLKHKMRKGWT